MIGRDKSKKPCDGVLCCSCDRHIETYDITVKTKYVVTVVAV